MLKMFLNTRLLFLCEITAHLKQSTAGRFVTLVLSRQFGTRCGKKIICHKDLKTQSVTKSVISKLNLTKGFGIIVFVLSGSLLFFTACEKIILSNPGKQVTVNKSISQFSEITVYDIFDIELKSDSVYSVWLSGYSEYLTNVSCTIDSGVLNIRDNNKFTWLADYPRIKITIGFPKLDRLWLEAPSHLKTFDTLKVQRFELISRGKTAEADLTLDVNYFILWTGSLDFGHYKVKGNAKSCYLWHQGNSIADTRDLKSDICEVYNYSIGNSYVNVISKLKVHLFSSGNIFYRGSPGEIITVEQSGKGRLIRLDN